MACYPGAGTGTTAPGPLTIALVTETMPVTSDAEITGGVEARVHYVARELSERHHVRIIADRTGGKRWKHASWRTVPDRLTFAGRTLVHTLRARADLVDSSNVVVHPIAWLAARMTGRPVVFWYPDVLLGSWRRHFGPIGIVGEIAERVVLRLGADHYIAISRTTEKKLIAHGIDPRRISVVPCGVPGALVDQLVHEETAKTHDIIVVGRLVGYKGIDTILHATARLRSTVGDVRVVIVGHGPQEGPLHGLADALGIRHCVEFTGFVPSHRDVLQLIARSRILVSASSVEGFGIVLAEAMALGVPYVASDIPVFREVSHDGTGGALFEVGSAEALADCASRLLTDDAAYNAASTAGIRLARQYRWDDIAAETEKVYRAVLDARTTSTRETTVMRRRVAIGTGTHTR